MMKVGHAWLESEDMPMLEELSTYILSPQRDGPLSLVDQVCYENYLQNEGGGLKEGPHYIKQKQAVSKVTNRMDKDEVRDALERLIDDHNKRSYLSKKFNFEESESKV